MSYGTDKPGNCVPREYRTPKVLPPHLREREPKGSTSATRLGYQDRLSRYGGDGAILTGRQRRRMFAKQHHNPQLRRRPRAPGQGWGTPQAGLTGSRGYELAQRADAALRAMRLRGRRRARGRRR